MILQTDKQKQILSLATDIKSFVESQKAKIVHSVNTGMLLTYWHIGRMIVDRQKVLNIDIHSDRQFIIFLSKELSKSIGKGYSRSNLFNMRMFYIIYPDVQTLSGQLSWSHYCELITISDKDKRNFYKQESENNNWSIRELQRQIETSLFERLVLSQGTKNKEIVAQLAHKGNELNYPEDFMKQPFVLEFLSIPENKPLKERDLEKKLIRHIEMFLLELGKGFMFVGSQQRITLNNTNYYVDMVFYNKLLKTYILIDLKRRKLKPADSGQMNMYLNYYKTEINDADDNLPIGIILCTEKDSIAAEYILSGLDNQIFAAQYTLCIPNKEKLIEEVKQIMKQDK
jgi:predicted nuclease of restriction endonuclease-like (RecB) superfamily